MSRIEREILNAEGDLDFGCVADLLDAVASRIDSLPPSTRLLDVTFRLALEADDAGPQASIYFEIPAGDVL